MPIPRGALTRMGSYVQRPLGIVADAVSALLMSLALSISIPPSCSYCQHPPLPPCFLEPEPEQLEVPRVNAPRNSPGHRPQWEYK